MSPVPASQKPISAIPARAGVGLKLEHSGDILECWPDVAWFEVHAENYMEDGGPPHHFLEAIRQRYPLSVHGVGLSIGADAPLDRDHLARFKAVCDRYQPGMVSEHLAWSTHMGVFLNDLLPIPYNQRSLRLICNHIDDVQTFLGRTILLENPSTYVCFQNSDITEIEFLTAVVRSTGCGLLLDVNNVYVSATNHGHDATAYVESFPMDHVGEIHLGGFAKDKDRDSSGARLLIDAHGTQVADPVWTLYERTITRGGLKPTLIEWDNDVPSWSRLHAEAKRADLILARRMADDEAA